jgi:hypothetical protein
MTVTNGNGTNGNGTHARDVILITGAAGWLGGILAQIIRKDPAYTDAQLILADIGKFILHARLQRSAS